MNKKNIALVAALLAAVVCTAFRIFPVLLHSTVMHWFEFPAVVLVFAFAGESHSPTELSAAVTFLSTTLLYWGFFIVIYALLLEAYLGRKAARHFREVHRSWELADNDTAPTFEQVGRAIIEMEAGRRRSLFLAHDDSIDLEMQPYALAVDLMAQESKAAAARSALKHLETHLTAHVGKFAARQAMDQLHHEARRSRGAGPAYT